jgi:RNA polymerase sigma-70 factor (ECF subfamily)
MMDHPGKPRDSITTEQFVVLITKHQRRIFQYILSLHPSLQEAEDILQETNLVLWKKLHSFEPGTNFLAWAMRIAHFEVLKLRRGRIKQKVSFLDDELIEQLGAEIAERPSYLDAVREALEGCLTRLRPSDRLLISRRYAEGDSGENLAFLMGRPRNSVYKSIGRIRRILLECITRSIARMEIAE